MSTEIEDGVVIEATEDDEDLEATDLDGQGDEGEGESGEWTPPTKDEWSKLQRQLKRANNQAVKYKQAAKEKETTAPSDDEVEAAKAEAEKAVEAKYKTRIVNSEAASMLKDMGLKGKPDRLLKLLDLDEIDVEDDGVEGLEEQLDALKADFPDLFEDKRKPKSDKRLSADAAEKPPAKPVESSADILARKMRTGKA